MPVTIRSADLGTMSEAELARVLDAAMTPSPEALASYLAELDTRIQVYERRYEIPSSDLPAALARHLFPETADISRWMFWVNVRTHLGREARA